MLRAMSAAVAVLVVALAHVTVGVPEPSSTSQAPAGAAPDGWLATLAACAPTHETNDDAAAQQWRLRTGSWAVENTLVNDALGSPERCLDVADWGTKDGSIIREYHCICKNTTRCPTHAAHPDKNYNQQWTLTSQGVVQSGSGTNMCLDASVAAAGGTVRLWACGKEAAPLQQWTYDATASRLRLTSNTSLCLSTASATPPPAPPAPPTPPPARPNPCANVSIASLPFCDVSKPPEERAADLVSRMTAAEKVTQISTYSFTSNHSGFVPGVPRLGVAAYTYHTEGLHGVRDSCDAPSTLYPQVTAMIATGNMTLVNEMAAEMGRQFRAAANAHFAEGEPIRSKGCGLSVYGPTINILRDPRWGRSQESGSEDPYFNGRYAVEFITGVQGDYETEGYLQVAATCKHIVAYSQEAGRMSTSQAVVSQQDLAETYLPAFKACVLAGAQQVMCSYNLLTVPGLIPTVGACYAENVLNTTLRGKWSFKGSVVSDCDAIAIHANRYATPGDAVAAGITAGCDQDCGGYYGKYASSALVNGQLSVEALDLALTRTLAMRFKLGEFDPAERVKYTQIPYHSSNSAFSQDSALRAAREAIALLQNNASVLPLETSTRLAVVGPITNDSKIMFGAKGDYNPAHVVTVYEGLAASGSVVASAAGCSNVKCEQLSLKPAVDAAKAADVTVLAIGVGPTLEGEGHDRSEITLPAGQVKLAQALLDAVGPKKLVVVLVNGGSVSLDFLKGAVPTIVEAFEGGQAAGTAIADVLFGRHNPSGVLPYTVYPGNYINQVAMSDFEMRPNTTSGSPGRTYRFYTGQPLWPFGHGLSYSTFTVAWSDTGLDSQTFAPADLAPGSTAASLKATVTNHGPLPGGKVVMAFVSKPSDPDAPKRSLVGITKVFLQVGETQTVRFNPTQEDAKLGACSFCTIDAKGRRSVSDGEFALHLGNGQVSQATLMLRVAGKTWYAAP
eukprot:m.165245 g.165245  ORF g.165245 m.165245 type:complete len:958 (+) comp17737_c0_seq1:57-2930(+)